jgi:hypothetical protein
LDTDPINRTKSATLLDNFGPILTHVFTLPTFVDLISIQLTKLLLYFFFLKDWNFWSSID